MHHDRPPALTPFVSFVNEAEFAQLSRAHSESAEHGGMPATFVCVSGADELSIRRLVSALAPEAAVVREENAQEYELLLSFSSDREQRALALHKVSAACGIETRLGVAHAARDGRTSETLRALARLRMEQWESGPFAEPNTVVLDAALATTYRLARTVAAGSINVLLLGETGTGKEVLARFIHRLSPRADGPFVALNCATFSETLLESELFGYEKGAFTGAVQAKAGLLESAAGGTVFLDEIGEMPATLQAKLLRVFEERCVRRVGSLKERPINVRLVAATNRNPQTELLNGRFRADLYYRLNGVTLNLPPLRERRADIEPLSLLFLERFAKSLGLSEVPALSRSALDLMLAYHWPGNVRELRNVLERAILMMAGSSMIVAAHLGIELLREPVAAPAPLTGDTTGVAVRQAARSDADLYAAEPEAEPFLRGMEQIVDALNRCGGNQTRAARLLGISRGTLIARIVQYGLPRPRGRSFAGQRVLEDDRSGEHAILGPSVAAVRTA
jgi:DNA-binding NtrC family response regulator